MTRRKPDWHKRLSALGLFAPPLLTFAGYHCCCGECPCTHCDGSSPPCCFKVVISGITEGTCGECSCLNDTFYAPRTANCTWWQLLTTRSFPCDSSPLQVTVYLDGSDYKLKVELGGNVWIKNYGGTKPTCEDLADESIAYSASGSDCDASSSTCLVTAIAGDENDVCPPLPFECGECRCNLLPRGGFQVVISGVTDEVFAPYCANCPNFDGTYILDTIVSACTFGLTLAPSICLDTQIRVHVGSGWIMVTTQPNVGISFRKVYGPAGTPVDCRILTNESLPPRGTAKCEIFAPLATCLVTSLP